MTFIRHLALTAAWAGILLGTTLITMAVAIDGAGLLAGGLAMSLFM